MHRSLDVLYYSRLHIFFIFFQIKLFFFFLHDGLMLLAGVVNGAVAFDGAPS